MHICIMHVRKHVFNILCFLFKNSSIVRRSLEIAHMEANSFGIEAKDIGCKERLWGRRSLFSQGRRSLLVSEIFLPALILEIEK